MPDWNKIHISDEAINITSQLNDLSEEDAFDHLLHLLENANSAKFKGEDECGVKIYRLENEYLYVKEQQLINYSRRNNYSKKIRLEVHAAEDGRCEQCGRPMHKWVIRIRRKDQEIFNEFNNYVLLCPDCDQNSEDPLIHAQIEHASLISYQAARGVSFEDAYKELRVTKDNLVLISLQKENSRLYWAPGLGRFILQNNILKLDYLEDSPMPVLQRKPQARSRRNLNQKED